MINEYICDRCRKPRSYGSGRFCRRCYQFNSTAKQAKKLCADLGIFLEEEFRAVVIVLLSLKVGQNIKTLRDITGYSRTEILTFSRNLKTSGIWDNGLFCLETDPDSPEFWVEFLLIIFVATGAIIRSSSTDGD